GLACAGWLRGNQRLEEAAIVLDVLAESTLACGVLSRALIAQANLAVVQHLSGDFCAALRTLQKIVDTHGFTCINRTVFDEAPGLAVLMDRARDQQQLVLPDIYLAVFSNVFSPTAIPAPPREATVPLSLTSKELEILGLLREGLPNQAISERTGIALSTTKWHLKNIFAKLGVSNRTAAIVQLGQTQPAQPSAANR
ncbi:MAG: helix-turn-helix transcriptional regulator, partial [Moraxellaceae bacterium]|nr:helix-turn-helix transcriptional regulator [Moraxellaceae bacterium]